MSTMNRQILLAARPVGFPKDSDFKLVESPIPNPEEGQILVRSIYVSVDPYMRGRMNDVKSYAPPVQIGGVMGGGVIVRGGSIATSRDGTASSGAPSRGRPAARMTISMAIGPSAPSATR